MINTQICRSAESSEPDRTSKPASTKDVFTDAVLTKFSANSAATSRETTLAQFQALLSAPLEGSDEEFEAAIQGLPKTGQAELQLRLLSIISSDFWGIPSLTSSEAGLPIVEELIAGHSIERKASPGFLIDPSRKVSDPESAEFIEKSIQFLIRRGIVKDELEIRTRDNCSTYETDQLIGICDKHLEGGDPDWLPRKLWGDRSLRPANLHTFTIGQEPLEECSHLAWKYSEAMYILDQGLNALRIERTVTPAPKTLVSVPRRFGDDLNVVADAGEELSLRLDQIPRNLSDVFNLIASTPSGKAIADEMAAEIRAQKFSIERFKPSGDWNPFARRLVASFTYTHEGKKSINIDLDAELGGVARQLVHERVHCADKDLERFLRAFFLEEGEFEARGIRLEEQQRGEVFSIGNPEALEVLKPKEQQQIKERLLVLNKLNETMRFLSENRAFVGEGNFAEELMAAFPQTKAYMEVLVERDTCATVSHRDPQIIISDYHIDPDFILGFDPAKIDPVVIAEKFEELFEQLTSKWQDF